MIYKEICETCGGRGIYRVEGGWKACACVIGIRVGEKEEDYDIDDEEDDDDSIYGSALVLK